MSMQNRGAPLKAVHIGPTPFFSDRGCHTRIRGLIRGLGRRGVQTVLCTYHLGNDVPGVQTDRIARIPGYGKLHAGPSGFKYLADVLLFFRVLRVVGRFRPDVIHGHLHEGALLGWVASRFWFWRRIPVIFDMQGSLVGELEEHAYFRRVPFLKSGFAAIEWMIDRMPQAITCSSPSSLQIARDRFRVPPERLHLVPEGTDVEPPDPAAGRDMAARLGIPTGRKVVVYTGALLPVKGLNTLLEVMRHTVARNLPVHFLLVGYPVDAAEAFIREHALSDHVTLTGRVAFDDIGPLLAAGDVAIEPKDAPSGEASGKLVNYMAAALPIVAFETPNNLKLLGETGCYASDGPESMVDRIDELVRKPDAGRSIGEAGRDRARTKLSWDSSAGTLYAIYTAALEDRTGTT